MSENNPPSVPTRYESSGNPAIEEILRLRHPMLPIMEGMYSMAHAFKAPIAPPDPLPIVQADRENLQALSPDELKQVLEQERATFERRQFYNYGISQQEIAHWSRLDAWTREEAVTLLLGRDPAKVTWAKIKHRLTQSAFVQLFQRLTQLVERAAPLQTGDRLDPAAVLMWGLNEHKLKPPNLLVELVEARSGKTIREVTTPPPPVQELPARRASTEKFWTHERVEELRAFHGKHKTKAAAEKYGISPQRVRELLKQDAPKPSRAPNSVFDLGRRK